MSGYQYRLALMHQEDLLEEARKRRIVREALCHRMRRKDGRCFRTQTALLLSRIVQVFQAGSTEAVDCNQSILRGSSKSCQAGVWHTQE